MKKGRKRGKMRQQIKSIIFTSFRSIPIQMKNFRLLCVLVAVIVQQQEQPNETNNNEVRRRNTQENVICYRIRW